LTTSYLLSLLISAFPVIQTSKASFILIQMLPMHVVPIIAMMILGKRLMPQTSLAEIFDLRRPNMNWSLTVRSCFLLAFGLNVAGTLLTVLMVVLLRHFGYEMEMHHPYTIEVIKNGNPAVFASIAFAAIIVAPLTEEIMFRFVFFESLRALEVRLPTVITALTFAMLHNLLIQIPVLLVLGIVLQYVRRQYRSMWAPIALHACFNAISVGMMLLVKLSSNIEL
jgi:membrane protease YdiL (CAAX protease family)